MCGLTVRMSLKSPLATIKAVITLNGDDDGDDDKDNGGCRHDLKAGTVRIPAAACLNWAAELV
ncbi:hypothetical protein E4U55_004125 [Claviceps digitariae]|nr:hypothetical protein E4U55_004125 [Claviceps digitariae]